MKKTTVLLFASLMTMVSFAQKNNVQSAGNMLKDEKLEEAKKYIDLSAENELTNNDPKMWYYRGKIYLAINDNKEKRGIDVDAAEKSVISFINCLKTDSKEMYKDEVEKLIITSTLRLYNRGIQEYNKKDYERAMRYYNQIFNVFPLDKEKSLSRNTVTPDVLNYNLYLVAVATKDNPKAKEYLQKLLELMR